MSEDIDDKTQVLPRAPAPVAAKTPSALLNCVDTSVLKDGIGAQIQLNEGEVSVGRDSENQVSLNAQGVSRYHARVFCQYGSWIVEDLGSTNGTRINNSKIDKKQILAHGDTVAFGRACYKFQLIDESNKGAQRGIDLDLGNTDKTMVMRPDERPVAATANAAPQAQVAARNTATSKPVAAKPVAAKRNDGSTAVLWLIVVVALVALVGGGAKLLGFF